MKEVLAVIRMNKMNATKQALADAGVSSFTARKVIGRGKGKVDYLLLQGAEARTRGGHQPVGARSKLIPKRMIIVVVPDKSVPLVVKTIIGVNRTGNPGDGKISCSRCAEAIRVRTGELDDVALDEN